MGRFETEIAKAKREVLQLRQDEWRHKWASENKKRFKTFEDALIHAPDPPDDLITNWFAVEWETGYMVADADHVAKLPKRTFNKLLKLGG